MPSHKRAGSVKISVDIDADIDEAIRSKMRAESRTLTAQINMLLRKALKLVKLAAAVLLLTLPVQAAQPITGKASVIDGDTILLAATHIRIHGIDAPEYNQTCTKADGSIIVAAKKLPMRCFSVWRTKPLLAIRWARIATTAHWRNVASDKTTSAVGWCSAAMRWPIGAIAGATWPTKKPPVSPSSASGRAASRSPGIGGGDGNKAAEDSTPAAFSVTLSRSVVTS